MSELILINPVYSSVMNIVFLDKLLRFNPFIFPISGISYGIGTMAIGQIIKYGVSYNNLKYLVISNILFSSTILPILLHKYLT